MMNTTDTSRFDTEYKRSPLWDAEAGDFARDGRNGIKDADGEAGIKAWCAKMIATERFQCLSYRGMVGDQLGTEMETARTFGNDHATTESMIKRTITEALLANPRITAVTDFEFEWDVDSVRGSCQVSALEMNDFDVEF